MIKIGLFFFSSVYERTGAGKVVRSFVESDDIFEAHGITMQPFTMDTHYDPAGVPQKKYGKENKLKSLANTLMKKTAVGSFKLIDRLYFGKGRTVVERHWENIDKRDAMIFHEIYTCNAYLEKCKACGITPKPYILILHTNGEVFKMTKAYYPNIDNSRYMKMLEKRADECMKCASYVVFVSQLSADKFKNLYPQYADKARVVYNGIAELSGQPSPEFDGILRMVTVGTVNVRKNQLMQVEAMGVLREKCKAKLTVIGGGDMLSACKEKAKSMGIEESVDFMGPRDDVEKILPNNNLFVMSSYDEGLPISAIEALRCGLPVILTDVGGNKELIDGNGILIKPNLDDLKNSILEMASKTIEEQQQMSERSKELFRERFSVKTMIDNYSKLVKTLTV